MMKLGINSNNECGKDVVEVLDNIKKVGFDNVMVAFKLGSAEQTLIEAKKRELNIPFVHLTTRLADDLWAKGETNSQYVESISNEIRLCGKYNVPVAVLHATNGNPSDFALPPSKVALDAMKEILKVAEECKVKIALENVDRPNFEHFLYLLDNIKSPWLGLCYDAGHHQLYCPGFDILEKYGDRILAVHLHDNLMDWEFGYDYTRDLHRLPFDGKIDYNGVCNKLAKTPYKDVVMLEIHKGSCGAPRIYDDMDALNFLKEAKKRAEKLSNMIEEFRK